VLPKTAHIHYRTTCLNCGGVRTCRCIGPVVDRTVESCPECTNPRKDLLEELKILQSLPMSQSSGQDSIEDRLYDDVSPTVSLRVAARYAVASNFFNVGDPILYGKYKNKHGILNKIFMDEKGHPAVEILPVPQGRKKPVIMQMYKFWHTPKE